MQFKFFLITVIIIIVSGGEILGKTEENDEELDLDVEDDEKTSTITSETVSDDPLNEAAKHLQKTFEALAKQSSKKHANIVINKVEGLLECPDKKKTDYGDCGKIKSLKYFFLLFFKNVTIF